MTERESVKIKECDKVAPEGSESVKISDCVNAIDCVNVLEAVNVSVCIGMQPSIVVLELTFNPPNVSSMYVSNTITEDAEKKKKTFNPISGSFVP